MKIPSVMTTAIFAVILGCALSTGGQQGTKKGSVPKNGQLGFIRATHPIAYLADGRIVAFPISMSEEEIEAAAKRIAGGAVELPPGAKVIGWEPVEDATSLLPEYEQRVATIPTTKGKLDALANAAGILQAQLNVLRELQKSESNYVSDRLLHHAKILDDHAARIDQAGIIAVDADNRLRNLDTQDLKRELDEFKDAACPVLRKAARGPRRSWDDVAGTMSDKDAQMKLDSACGVH
jgi:hypothetical protein